MISKDYAAMMEEFLSRLRKIRIVPVAKIDDSKKAGSLAKALRDGGLPCAEVTFRTEAATEAIRIMKCTYPDMFVGAGTVLNIRQADEAINAGASFIVSPGFSSELTEYCLNKGIPILPGTSTASEMMAAIACGIRAVKFFPAMACGGLPAIKAYAAPFPQLTFIPTGGLNEKNIKEFLDFPQILACGESWMVNDLLLENDDFDEVQRRSEFLSAIAKSCK